MAKRTDNDAHSLNGKALPHEFQTTLSPLSDSFTSLFQEFSPNLHVFAAQDNNHELACKMTVEIKEMFVSLEDEGEEGAYLASVVACSFPAIDVENLHKITGCDSYLQGILMFQFQLKILEQLLLFCEEKGAVNLILTVSDAELDYLEVYSRFFVSEERIGTSRGEQTQVMIPTDVHTYDEIVDFMDELEKDFRKILWRGQNANPVFREYLKLNSCLRPFSE